jgi:hypothetical protein
MREPLARKRAEYAGARRGELPRRWGSARTRAAPPAGNRFWRLPRRSPVCSTAACVRLFRAVVSAEDAPCVLAPIRFCAPEAVNRANDERLPRRNAWSSRRAHGIEAARAAGMRCVAVTTSHRPDQLSAAAR